MTSILCWYTHLFRDCLKTGRIYGDKECRLHTGENSRSIGDAISDNESVVGQDHPALHGEAGDLEVREDQDGELEYLDTDTNEDDLESSVPPVIV